jgi:hypothetical protein
VQQPDCKRIQTTALREVMREHLQGNPLAAAPCQVGVNGVRKKQWVVTLYRPRTCVPTGVAAAPITTTPAAPAAAGSTVFAAPDSAGAATAPAAAPAAVAPCAAASASVCPELASVVMEDVMSKFPIVAVETPVAAAAAMGPMGVAAGAEAPLRHASAASASASSPLAATRVLQTGESDDKEGAAPALLATELSPSGLLAQ